MWLTIPTTSLLGLLSSTPTGTSYLMMTETPSSSPRPSTSSPAKKASKAKVALSRLQLIQGGKSNGN